MDAVEIFSPSEAPVPMRYYPLLRPHDMSDAGWRDICRQFVEAIQWFELKDLMARERTAESYAARPHQKCRTCRCNMNEMIAHAHVALTVPGEERAAYTQFDYWATPPEKRR